MKPPSRILHRQKAQLEDARRLGFAYKLAPESGQFGLDVAFSDDVRIDEQRMSAVIPFADGNRRDGVGDLLEVTGIHTERHRKNPLVLFDHGKEIKLPIALTEEPDSKAYTVTIDPQTRTASAVAYFYQGKGLAVPGRDAERQHALLCEQLFDLIARKFLRAGSIGYQVIRSYPLEAEPQRGIPRGLHLLETLLLEVSAVVLPANSDTVSKMLALPEVCGKPLSPYLVKSLAPYAPVPRVQLGYEPGRSKSTDSKSLREKYRMGKELKGKIKEMEQPKEKLEEEPKPETPDETPQEDGKDEMWGAQVLRAVHRDHLALLQDYDEMLKPLENTKVRKLLEKKLMSIDKELTELEETFVNEYPEYEALEGRKDADEDAVETDSEEEELPTPDEAVEGMEKKQLLQQRTKELRGKYATKKKDEDEWKDCGRYERCKKEMCAACGKENCQCSAKDMIEEEVPPAAAPVEHDMKDHERSCIKNAHGFLGSIMSSKEWTDAQRMDSYHHGKTLLGIHGGNDPQAEAETGMKADPGTEEWSQEEMQEPEHQEGSWRKSCKGAGDFFMELSNVQTLEDMHREKAAHWHKQLESMTRDEMQAGSQGPEQTTEAMDAAKSLREEFSKQDTWLETLNSKLAKLGAL